LLIFFSLIKTPQILLRRVIKNNYAIAIALTVIPTGNCTLALTPPGLAVNAALTASLTEGVVPTVK